MKLQGKKVAILATDGFEESELSRPYDAVKNEGATVHIVSPKSGTIKSWDENDWGKDFDVDKTLDEVSADDYDMLVLPGGQINPDKLRIEEKAVTMVRDFFKQKKPVAAICHGPWLLVEADVVNGRKVTSYKSIKTDLKNAGANWVDKSVVVDQGLVTSRTPDDLDDFCKKVVEECREGKHDRMSQSV